MEELTFSPHPLWLGCIAFRLCIVEWTAWSNASGAFKLKTAIFLAIISAGFAWKAFTGSNDEIQVRKVFWHDTRATHSLLFALAALSHVHDRSSISSWNILLVDIAFSFIYRAYTQLWVRASHTTYVHPKFLFSAGKKLKYMRHDFLPKNQIKLHSFYKCQAKGSDAFCAPNTHKN